MKYDFIDDVYYTLDGQMTMEGGIPGVENAFESGKPCDLLYAEVYNANMRLCQRLGVDEDMGDSDVDTIFMQICEIMGKKMYEYGAKFGMPGK